MHHWQASWHRLSTYHCMACVEKDLSAFNVKEWIQGHVYSILGLIEKDVCVHGVLWQSKWKSKIFLDTVVRQNKCATDSKPESSSYMK